MNPHAAIQTQTTALILAGGAGRRMGGQDKGLLPFTQHGRTVPLIQPVLEVLAPQVDQLIISANRHLADYATLGFSVISDEIHAAFQGPAQAIMHARRYARHDWLLIAPCDLPFYQAHWPQQLFLRQKQTRAAVIIAHDGQRLQPTVALIHRPCLTQRPCAPHMSLSTLLMAGRYALCDLSADADAFINCNTPAQLATATAQMSPFTHHGTLIPGQSTALQGESA
ncbi:MAG TPA: NTP transferase domain-containing protein [Halothiobacillus sp.]|nr:NTP transferase domain-containing protein [Halothiobacillus sp.]